MTGGRARPQDQRSRHEVPNTTRSGGCGRRSDNRGDGLRRRGPVATAGRTRGERRAAQDRRAGGIPAPIERVEVLIRESFPPQYVFEVTSGLPNACFEFSRISHEQLGDVFEIEVTNTRPAAQDIACAEIYRTVTNSVVITEVLEAGREFTVRAGDKEANFTGQGGPV